MSETTEIGSRIKEARKAEGYTQQEMAELTGIPYSSYKFLERANGSSENLQKVMAAPRMKRYTLWIMTGETEPTGGQVDPGLMKKLGGGKTLNDAELMELCGVEKLSGDIVDIDALKKDLMADLKVQLLPVIESAVSNVIEKHR